MGLCYYFTLMTLEFWKRSGFISELWLLYSNEVGCGEFIITHKQQGPIFQGSITIL
jgi:hypothetical protein